MHPRRKDMLFVFGVVCLMVFVFAVATIRMPHFFFALFLVLFFISALLLGYRVFAYSDDWFRAQEYREAAWYARHPRLMVCVAVAGVIGFVFQLIQLFRTLFA